MYEKIIVNLDEWYGEFIVPKKQKNKKKIKNSLLPKQMAVMNKKNLKKKTKSDGFVHAAFWSEKAAHCRQIKWP